MHSLKFCTLGKNSFVPNTPSGFRFLSLGFTNICNKGSSQFLLILKALHTYSSKVVFTTLTRWKVKKANTISEGDFCMKERSESKINMPVTGLWTHTIFNTYTKINISKCETNSAPWRSVKFWHSPDNKSSSQQSVKKHSSEYNPHEVSEDHVQPKTAMRARARHGLAFPSPGIRVGAQRWLQSMLCIQLDSFSNFSDHNLFSLIFLCPS